MKKTPTILILLGVLLLAGMWAWTGYNEFVAQKATLEQEWAQVETQYQRRVDLVPNLVSTVKGAAAFEQETFTAVTEARSQWQSAGSRDASITAATSLDSALSRLLVTVESYPTLQATQAFRDLMAQLEGTENRIAVARKDYNEAVRNYNVLVQRFPSVILAKLFGYDAEMFFEASEGAENAPTVEF